MKENSILRHSIIVLLISMGAIIPGWAVEPLVFYAKKMEVTNCSSDDSTLASQTNSFLMGDYVCLAADEDGEPLHSVGAVTFSPKEDRPIPDGLYEIHIDIQHRNIKMENSGDPPRERNGYFEYQIALSKKASGKLSMGKGVSKDWIQYYPEDPDNCDNSKYYAGPVALTNIIAYGPSAVEGSGAKGLIELTNVKACDLIFRLRDCEKRNYGFIGLKSVTLVPVEAKSRKRQIK